uniref:Minor tail protein n=1 Tax=Streptomyces sp. NBC_00049 TaxID=2903617 RepID=A0AAU2JUA6_9ACTN
MPQLPEDIIDRLTAMERRIQQLSTAVNTRPALNTISGGEVRISDGGSLSVVEPVNGTKILGVGAWSPTEYGLEIKRKSGKTVLSVRNVVTGDYDQAFRVFDSFNNEIVADDVVAGGLARPWLAMLPPQDTSTTRWPQTNATGWTTVARSFNPIWQPKMRLYCLTAAAAGVTGKIRVLVDGEPWGPEVTTPTVFDNTGKVAPDVNARFGSVVKIEIQAMVTGGTGLVYVQPMMLYGTQS